MESPRRRSAKTKEERKKEDDNKNIRAAARAMFASLFLGGSSPWGEDALSNKASSSSSATANNSREPAGNAVQRQAVDASNRPATSSPPQQSENPLDPALAGLVRQAAEQVRILIPEDRQQLKQTSLYKEAYRGIQWQRDNYLVGREYANWRVKERYRLDPATTRSVQSYLFEIQYDASALAHPQFARLAASFVPSDTVKNSLVPLLVPVIENPLYPLARQGLVGLIEGQGDNLNHVLKDQILQFLSNPQNRADMKRSTRGYISTTTSSSSSAS